MSVVLPNTISAATEMVAAEVQGNDVALRDAINNTVLPLIENLRHVFGQVGSDGSIARAGSANWSVSRVATGVYTVTFSGLSVSGTNVYPTVTPAVSTAGASINAVSSTGFTYVTTNPAGTINEDHSVMFNCEVIVVT